MTDNIFQHDRQRLKFFRKILSVMGKKLSVMLKNIVGHWQNIVAALIKLSRKLQKLSGIYYIPRMPGNVSVQNDNIGV